jgi:hypothetical protein
LIIDVKKALNVCVNIKGNGMTIKKYFGIAQSTTGQVTAQTLFGISQLYGKTRTALSSKTTELKDFMSAKQM